MIGQMNASELRIGNWVEDPDRDYPVFITGVEPNWNEVWLNWRTGSAVYKKNIEEINPRPLTEEWLDRFGFKKEAVVPDYVIEGILEVWHSTDGKHETLIEDDDGDVVNGPDIHYVHQLQNLYFALTGEELTIKEND